MISALALGELRWRAQACSEDNKPHDKVSFHRSLLRLALDNLARGWNHRPCGETFFEELSLAGIVPLSMPRVKGRFGRLHSEAVRYKLFAG
jgi:hypothetical protein